MVTDTKRKVKTLKITTDKPPGNVDFKLVDEKNLNKTSIKTELSNMSKLTFGERERVAYKIAKAISYNSELATELLNITKNTLDKDMLMHGEMVLEHLSYCSMSHETHAALKRTLNDLTQTSVEKKDFSNTMFLLEVGSSSDSNSIFGLTNLLGQLRDEDPTKDVKYLREKIKFEIWSLDYDGK